MTKDRAAAWAAMPRDAGGDVISLFFVPPAVRSALERQWQAWSAEWPTHLHPPWLAEWAEYRRTGRLPPYVGNFRPAPMGPDGRPQA